MRLVDENAYPSLARVVNEVLAIWPEHERYFEKSLGGRDAALLKHSDRLSSMVIRLAGTIDGSLKSLAKDYRFLCEEIVLPEEFHFRRSGTYRLTKFEDALKTVYNNSVFMTRYM